MTSMQTRRYLKQTVFVALNCVTGMTAALQLTESIDPVIVQHHVGKIIFVELLTPDLAASRQFYSSMFGWTYQTTTNGGSDYVEAWLNGSRVAGLQYKAQSVGRLRQPVWLNFMAVRNVDAARVTALQHGGKVLFEPHNIPDRGREAVFSDPQGAVFAVLAAGGGDPPDELADPGEWIWSSLITTNADTNAAFYQQLFDYDVVDLSTDDDAEHLILASENYARASVNTLPVNGQPVRPHWINFIRVDDTVKMTEKLRVLGGQVLVEPRLDRHGGKVALVADPLGTPFGLIEWTDTQIIEVAK